MSSSTLGFSSFDSDSPKKRKKGDNRQRSRTIKKRNRKVESFLKSMDNNTQNEDKQHAMNHSASERGSDGSDLASFQQFPPNPVLTRTPDETTPAQYPGSTATHTDENGLLKEGMQQQKKYYENLENNYYNQYIPNYTGTQQNIPYYSQLANSQELTGPKDELMHKLNYLIHLLEEQKDGKTENVTEELVLYMFLGVFVIFVVDSFARASKYTR